MTPPVAFPRQSSRPGRIVAFLCNWCSYAGADLAGVSRLQYPAHIRIVRIPCSARMDPSLVTRAYLRGADGVVVAGCHPGDCHYTTGNLHARRRISLLARLLDHAGLEDGRFHLSWVSASESARFASLMRMVGEKVQALGPQTKLLRPKAETIQDPDLDSPETAWPTEPARKPAAPGEPRPEAEQELRALARTLLEEGKVDVVTGWKSSTNRYRPKPAFVERPADADALIIPQYGTVNLATFLPRIRGTVALAGRPCEIRAALQLIQEGQLERDNVTLIGMDCAGILSPNLERQHPDGPRIDQLTDACRDCPDRKPPLSDHDIQTTLSGTGSAETTRTVIPHGDDRWDLYLAAMSRCIQCHACQRACPLCYCKRCFVDRTPAVVEPGRHPVDNAMYHMVRAMHMAGRCVSCGACDRACPKGLAPSWLARRLAVDAEELFDHAAGTRLDGRSAVEEFSMDDTQKMVTEP